jgi:hypothetical protein
MMNDIVHEGTAVIATENQGGAVTPMRLLEIATQRGGSVDELAKLMDLQLRWEQNQAKKAFDAAVSAAKSEIPVIIKNREVDFTSSKGRTNYRHEDFAVIARTIDPILAQHGLSYRFRTSSKPNEPVIVTCILAHRDGHSEENSLDASRDDTGNKNGIQAIGSTITYLQRYTLKAALGIAVSADDDGRGAGNGTEVEPDAAGKKALDACGSLPALEAAWKALTKEQRKTLAAEKEACKQRILEADKA